ncbi:hypothetical protein Patl1_16283 [Pistacia atlantica]|uniref:Uncharacterized protein n=1 Tax=Pistacia atlantica TaxID=434234 RepID=A0ACC1BAQ2_9ROSI|nr:hypothetical protein Patl1_16283 [Pistacia atlantica]
MSVSSCNVYQENLPDEFGMLSSLTIIREKKTHTQQSLKRVLPSSLSNLSLLNNLDAHAWRLSDTIPDEFEKQSSLEKLDLGHNNFCHLSYSLRGLSYLKDLVLANCKELKFLPLLASSLVKLNVANCTALESISDLTILASLLEFDPTNCTKNIDIPGLQCLKSLTKLYMGGCDACFPKMTGRLGRVLFLPSSTHTNRHTCVVFSLGQTKQEAFRDKLTGIVDIHAKIIRLDVTIYTTVLDLRGVPEIDEDQLHLCRYVDFGKLVLMLK